MNVRKERERRGNGICKMLIHRILVDAKRIFSHIIYFLLISIFLMMIIFFQDMVNFLKLFFPPSTSIP